MSHTAPSKELLDCMKACSECSSTCIECAHHCLHMGGKHASPEHQGLMHDCAEVCALVARFIARGSRHASHLCTECAEICNACAESCERLAQGDAMMLRCAQACRRCAALCETHVGAGV